MTTIETGRDIATLVNVFTVEPERQQELLDVLIEATEQVISKMPGFISANFHRSLDGTRVVNYAQWRSRDDLETMLRHPDARPHLEAASAIATAEPHLYDVVHIDEAADA